VRLRMRRVMLRRHWVGPEFNAGLTPSSP